MKSLGWVFAASGITSPSPRRASPQVTDEGHLPGIFPSSGARARYLLPKGEGFSVRGGITPPYMALYKNVSAQADTPNLKATLSTLNSA